MKRDIQNAIEYVGVKYFKPTAPTAPPQNVEISEMHLPVPYGTGDVALAAMIKGLQEFYLNPMQEKTGQTIELDPKLKSFYEEVLSSFWKDVDQSLGVKPTNIIL